MDKMDRTKEAIVVGSQLSTFTRTICMGLMLKGVGFSQVLATPHSKDAKEHHPMGRVPSFYHTGSWIFESAAIATYIDLIYTDQPRLHDPSEGEDGSALEQARVKQWSSFASDYVFNTLEHHLIKPSVTLLQKNKNPNASREEQEEVRVLQKYVQDGYDKSREVLQVIEDHLEKQQQGGGHFLLGKKVSWADLYLAPVIADFHAVSLGRGLLEEFPHLKKWFFEFSKQDCFLKTYPGSLSQVLLEAAN